MTHEEPIVGVPKAESWRLMCVLVRLDREAEERERLSQKQRETMLLAIREYAAYCRGDKS